MRQLSDREYELLDWFLAISVAALAFWYYLG